MRRSYASPILALAVVVSVVALPLSAHAGNRQWTIPETQFSEFHLKGAGGYSIRVFGNRRVVYLTAQRAGTSITYSAHGFTLQGRLKARFSRFGRVSVRFHPRAAPRLIPLPEGNCKGRGGIVSRGTFVGRIRFEGEQGYTAVHASRANGKVVRELKQTCTEEPGGAAGWGIHWTMLTASTPSDLLFTASKVVSNRIPGSTPPSSVRPFLNRVAN